MGESAKRRKTPEEQLQDLEQKIAQLQAKKQRLKNAQNKKDRAARTKRLIERGAIMEKAWKAYFPDDDIEELNNKMLQEKLYPIFAKAPGAKVLTPEELEDLYESKKSPNQKKEQ